MHFHAALGDLGVSFDDVVALAAERAMMMAANAHEHDRTWFQALTSMFVDGMVWAHTIHLARLREDLAKDEAA
jgi:hypothetical protein